MAAVFVPTYSWQPLGLSKAQALRVAGKAREFYQSLSDIAKRMLRFRWDFWGRPAQQMPPPSIVPHKLGWKFWIFLAGRGFGKTRLAAEVIRTLVEREEVKRIALIGPTYRDVVQTMIRGESGLFSVFPEQGAIRLRFVKQDGEIQFTRGQRVISRAFVYTGEEPERLRGPQHDFAWFDELGAFKHAIDVWQLFAAGHRLGANPRAVFTTTPRASLLQIDGLLDHPRAVTTFGKSKDNEENLAPDFLSTLESIYKDSEFEQQELGGVLRLDDTGALFRADWIQESRVEPKKLTKVPNQVTIDGVPILKWVVAVDPSGSSKKTACECGIIVVGLGADNKAYVVEDRSKRATPDEWARTACLASRDWQNADIVYEKNFGDEMVGTVIRAAAKDLNMTVKVIAVDAVADKVKRAMLVSPLVQKKRVRLVGFLGALERQLTTWGPGSSTSPDRLDAFVWAVTHLLLKQVPRVVVT